MSVLPPIAYPDLARHPLVAALAAALADADADAPARFAALVFDLRRPVALAIADAVLASDGPFASLAARGAPLGAGRREVAARELAHFGSLANGDIASLLARVGLGPEGPAEDDVDARAIPPAARALRSRLAASRDWGELVDDVARFHASQGVGELATRRVLRWHDGRLVGVAHPDPASPADLIGGEDRRAPLVRSLTAFVRGGPAVDALLYGPPGTGKSTAARAIAATFADDGLRLVQVDRGEIASLRPLFERVDGGPRCLVLLDDLVFDEGDRTDRELRGVLEGDVAARPANVLVWATSNRMRLLHESRTDREDDLESDLGRGERSALATRFGVRVAFPAVTVDEFVAIAAGLVERRLGHVPAGLAQAARRFAVDRGLTPRAARQFADLAVGEVVAAGGVERPASAGGDPSGHG